MQYKSRFKAIALSHNHPKIFNEVVIMLYLMSIKSFQKYYWKTSL